MAIKIDTTFGNAIVKATPQFYDLRRLLVKLKVSPHRGVIVDFANIKTRLPGSY